MCSNNVVHRIFDGGHPRADAERFDAALQRSNPFLKYRVSGIADSAVDIPDDIVIE
jgi:hypothetical protein